MKNLYHHQYHLKLNINYDVIKVLTNHYDFPENTRKINSSLIFNDKNRICIKIHSLMVIEGIQTTYISFIKYLSNKYRKQDDDTKITSYNGTPSSAAT